MVAPRIRGALSLAIVVAAAACGGGGSEPTTATPSALDIVSGNGQVGLVGFPLTVPLVVRVSGNGSPVKGATVTFAVTNGAASVSPSTATTDSVGQAKATVTLGSSPGNVTISATVAGTNLTAAFVETAGASSQPAACSTGSPTTPTAGAVVPGVTGTGICLGGGTGGADYAVVAFYGNADSSATTSINVSAHGATPLSTASVGTLGGAPSPLLTPRPSNTLQGKFDRQLRASARRDLTSMIPSARAQRAQRARAAFASIPANPAIGSLVTLNAQGNIGFSCTNPINVIARVAAVSNLAIVVADTANPAGGFTDAEYQGFATTFDTLISPLDVSAFGAQSDIDGNGKTIIFFTKEVNRLTPKGSPDGVIGGFFHERDLFPVTAQNGLQACPGSNFAEMYYSLVPDSIAANTGRYGDIRTKTYVQSLTLSTLVHEFQHLINASRRLYVNNAPVFEDVWLNEGLSHIAEELLFSHVAGVPPRSNIAASNFTGNQPLVDAFNNYQGDNFGRYEEFLRDVPQASPYAENDNLETRGATWNLLRYLADHRGASDGDVWFQLDNSVTAGQSNLRNVFGADYLTQIRDWATSVFADDVVGQGDPRFSQPSWNMRSIFPALCTNAACTTHLGRFPISLVPLSDATPASVAIISGSAAYFRFSVPANTSASIDWSNAGLPVTGLMQFTVVRTR